MGGVSFSFLRRPLSPVPWPRPLFCRKARVACPETSFENPLVPNNLGVCTEAGCSVCVKPGSKMSPASGPASCGREVASRGGFPWEGPHGSFWPGHWVTWCHRRDSGLIQAGNEPPWAAFCYLASVRTRRGAVTFSPVGAPRAACHCLIPGPRPHGLPHPPARLVGSPGLVSVGQPGGARSWCCRLSTRGGGRRTQQEAGQSVDLRLALMWGPEAPVAGGGSGHEGGTVRLRRWWPAAGGA